MSIYDYTPVLVYGIVLAAALGACMGSFLNCTAWRMTHGESFIRGRSHCTTCGHALSGRDLIPVVSWAAARGRCRYCGEKVSARYPLTEVFFAAVTVACLLRFDLTVVCLRNYVFLCCLFLLTLTDLETMYIPDGCHIVAAAAWVAACPFLGGSLRDVWMHILSAVVFGGGFLLISLLMDHILGRESLGGGDIKLMAVTGLYLGFAGTLFTCIFSCLAGLLFGVLRRRDRTVEDVNGPGASERPETSVSPDAMDLSNGDEGSAFPFGPWIALAAAFMLLFGQGLVNWYVGLLI